ncbi:hypothetical protein CLAFUW4_12451 [Fulvia fulva]|uniref:Uncharacterized protein n=1 Tax=Passalora fulva TaxID=5499 RepID=A0A9Q8PF37_PASFU|nr:uncharacterized protein CLAFUR5_11479 [Fulvia fulva]KAK4617578.1 hypothetical protein CLAFUR4_12456 [Fulvia fulva]KAK4618468.1 hypothetical protein CLAFUR0_12467 [Fulvia fulva]UJO21271.1 hypothetical protein CLAFUR5_11479 [Fulvia fulva]WPV18483.1 hypothetical protein CLAFUW4_12451 [Fulvia fulva]WPV33041.1 hypothetical protein CLAFUW7_12458 [Fulvia fulva]
MSSIQKAARWLLVLHGIGNIAQGTFSILRPDSFASAAGPRFLGSPDQAIQSIGLGSLGVGIYGAAGALSNDRRFFVVTAAMRFLFGLIVATQWDWDANWEVFAYKWGICCISAMAAS